MNIIKKCMVLTLIFVEIQINCMFNSFRSKHQTKTTNAPFESCTFEMNADDYPELKEGFTLIGRPLQPFIDEHMVYTMRHGTINPQETLKTVRKQAENKIKETLLNDSITQANMQKIINDLVSKKINLNEVTDPVFQFCINTDFMKFNIINFFPDDSTPNIEMEVNKYNNAKFTQDMLRLGINSCRLMHNAIKEGSHIVVKELLSQGYDPNTKYNCDYYSKSSNYPLHLAVETKQKEIIKLLIAAGANLHREDHHNKIPWDLARSKSVRDLLEPSKSTMNETTELRAPLDEAIATDNETSQECTIS